MTPLRQRMLDDMQLRDFSPHTQGAYIRAVEKFSRYFKLAPETRGAFARRPRRSLWDTPGNFCCIWCKNAA